MLKNILPLSFIVASRFLGLFIIMPTLVEFAINLKNSNKFLVAVFMGSYPIMQMFLQVPFGILSDKIGRKKTLAIGIIIFAIGSVVCYFANDIYTIILGRIVQGCGAIGSVASALIADFTNEEERSKAMAIMGAMIGVSFAISMVAGPLLSAKIGFSSLFLLSAVLSMISLILLFAVVSKEPIIKSNAQKVALKELLKNKDILIINLTNFLQKMFMSITFTMLSITLIKTFSYPKESVYQIYILCSVFGFLSMGFAGSFAEKKAISKQIILSGILCFVASFIVYAIAVKLHLMYLYVFGAVLFFVGFNLHEPVMQGMASKLAKSTQKGSVIGVFNSCGYLGSFVGSFVWLAFFSKFGLSWFALFVALLGLFWFLLFLNITNPAVFKNLYLLKDNALDLNKISNFAGIVDCYQKDEKIVIKYNSKILDEKKIITKLGVKL